MSKRNISFTTNYASLLPALLPWLGYLVATLLLLRKLLPLIGDHLPGQTDSWQSVWNIWWVKFVLLDHPGNIFHNLYTSDYIYYPTGGSLLFHTYAPINGVLFLPLNLLLGPLVTTNIIFISSFVFTGMAAYALGRGLGLGMFGAWLGGAVYAFGNPSRWNFFGGGQSGYISMMWMPLYILCLVKATQPQSAVSDTVAASVSPTNPPSLKSRIPKLKYHIGAALFLVANALVDWQFFVYMGIFTVLYSLYLLLRERTWRQRWAAIASVVAIGLAALLLLSPLLYATVRAAIGNSGIVRPLDQSLLHSFDLTSYITPNAVNPIYGGWAATQNFSGNLYGDVQGVSNCGYIPMALALVGLLAYRRLLPWALFGLFFAILSLGPHLFVNDVDTGILLPYDLMLKIPFFNIIRDPARFSLTAYLCIGLLAGFGWQAVRAWLARFRPQSAVIILAAIVATLTVGEFANVSYPISTRPVSPFYYQLGRDPGDYAILEVPIADKFYADYNSGLQYIHQKRILRGQTSRKPCYCFAMQTPVVQWFWNLRLPSNGDIIAVPPPTIAPAVLRAFDIRYIILWKWALPPADYAKAQRIVAAAMPGATPTADDAAVTAYAVPLSATTNLLPLALDDNWPDLEQSGYGPQRWVESEPVSFKVVNTAAQPRQAQLAIKLQSFHQSRTLQISLNGQPLPSQTILPQLQTVLISLTLSPGSSEIKLSSPEPPIVPAAIDPHSSDKRALDFAVLNIAIQLASYALDSNGRPC